MLIQLGAAIQMKVQHLQLRGGIYQFYLRIPQHLLAHYGKNFIRKSLGTSDLMEAANKAEAFAKKYKAEFAAMTKDGELTSHGLAVAGQKLADQYGMNLDLLIEKVLDPAREKYANGDERLYKVAHPSDYLNDVQLAALDIVANPNAVRLSKALSVYFNSHPRGADDAFIKYTTRHWTSLIEVIGDIEFEKLSRDHIRQFVDQQLEKGNKTGTVRRMLKTLVP